MKQVVLKLNKRSVPDKIEFAGIIVLQMTNNPHFSSPNPSRGYVCQRKST
ncbi:MAG: hypothetical protein ACT4ON_03675 [Bacteroidota bacterium]